MLAVAIILAALTIAAFVIWAVLGGAVLIVEATYSDTPALTIRNGMIGFVVGGTLYWLGVSVVAWVLM